MCASPAGQVTAHDMSNVLHINAIAASNICGKSRKTVRLTTCAEPASCLQQKSCKCKSAVPRRLLPLAFDLSPHHLRQLVDLDASRLVCVHGGKECTQLLLRYHRWCHFALEIAIESKHIKHTKAQYGAVKNEAPHSVRTIAGPARHNVRPCVRHC